jgi:hypothetical protein
MSSNKYYTMRIGQAVFDAPKADGGLTASVPRITYEEAPSFVGDAAKNSNERSPYVYQWEAFCEAAGLTDLFFNKINGLLTVAPGIKEVTRAHLNTIQKAKLRWMDLPWGAMEQIPGWNPNKDHDPRYDTTLARLLWLEWWFRHALENCANPAFDSRLSEK